MNDWRSGLLLRTFQRLALRAPLVVVLVGGLAWITLLLLIFWAELFEPLESASETLLAQVTLLALGLLLGVTLVILSTFAMSRPLWERHAVGLKGLMRGVLFGVLVLMLCLAVAGTLIGGALFAAPLEETPHAYTFLHRSGLIAILLLCASPGVFALVVSIRERQGYSTVARIWRIDRAQTVRGVFLIMLLTTCVAAVAIVGASLSFRGAQSALFWFGADIPSLTTYGWGIRAGLTAIFTIIAFTTAHVVQYERIRDWESGGDVTGVFD